MRDEPGALILATAHGTKGLEFDHVAVVGMDEGVFPSDRSIDGGARPRARAGRGATPGVRGLDPCPQELVLVYDPDAPSIFMREAFSAAELRPRWTRWRQTGACARDLCRSRRLGGPRYDAASSPGIRDPAELHWRCTDVDGYERPAQPSGPPGRGPRRRGGDGGCRAPSRRRDHADGDVTGYLKSRRRHDRGSASPSSGRHPQVAPHPRQAIDVASGDGTACVRMAAAGSPCMRRPSNGWALSTHGRLDISTAGLATISAGATTKQVYGGVDITSRSFVLLTPGADIGSPTAVVDQGHDRQQLHHPPELVTLHHHQGVLAAVGVAPLGASLRVSLAAFAPEVDRVVDLCPQVGDGLAPAKERLGVRVEHTRLGHVEGTIASGSTACRSPAPPS